MTKPSREERRAPAVISDEAPGRKPPSTTWRVRIRSVFQPFFLTPVKLLEPQQLLALSPLHLKQNRRARASQNFLKSLVPR